MRAFIAVELPEQFRCEAAALARQLERSVDGRFIAPQNYHVTLAFLGDIDDAGVRAAMDALEAACEGVEAIPIESDGLGKFGESRDATLWMGVKSGGRLEDLARAVREELSARGVDFDSKPFKSHVTLARRANVSAGALSALPFPGSDLATNVTLFKSELSSQGATYHPLFSVGFRE